MQFLRGEERCGGFLNIFDSSGEIMLAWTVVLGTLSGSFQAADADFAVDSY